MTEIKAHQKLPNNWNDREKLREKGQFWTPHWVAEAMVEYVLYDSDSELIFDPATGKGAFYETMNNIVSPEKNITFYGIDIDEKLLNGDPYNDKNCIVELRDFILHPPKKTFKSIIANPPYIRHHRLSETIKNRLREISKRIVGFAIDGRAGLHIYFFIQALSLLEKGGKLAFIMPADTCEGIFAQRLWKWIAANYCIECVVTFLSKATPFPNVDTNAMVFLIKKHNPKNKIFWVQSKEAWSIDLRNFVSSGFKITNDYPSLQIINRDLKEALSTGLSRPPANKSYKYKLKDFAKVMRGIATGANEYFYMTSKRAKELNIPKKFLKPAIAKTRDAKGEYITKETITKLDKQGKPTLLFSLDGRKLQEFPKSIQDYILYGEKLGINNRTLIKTRKPWYKMEQREIPDLLFAYLGRRNVRFIKNKAKVLPLTGFLCVFPHFESEESKKKLWKILNHPETINNLSLVGKSYGSGAIKVEPRALGELPIPDHLVEKYNLHAKITKKGGNGVKS